MIIKKVEANAKINLGLNILGKTKDNYHELDMIMAPISLYDTMEIKFYEKKGNLKISTNKYKIPLDSNNIIYKIYEEYYNVTALQKEKVEVYLNKRIPSQAGLGGGSSDGAFFLRTLNEYHDDILSLEEMMKLGKKIGADIPFFLINQTCRAQGIGEKITIVENNLDVSILLIKPKLGISTKKAYEGYSKLGEKKWANIEKVVEGLKDNNLLIVNKSIENHLQQSALFLNKKIKTFEENLKRIDTNFKMSGSGSCYYLISEKETSKSIYNRLLEEFGNCFISSVNFI